MKVIAEKMGWKSDAHGTFFAQKEVPWRNFTNTEYTKMADRDCLTPAGAVAVWNKDIRVRMILDEGEDARFSSVPSEWERDFCTAVKNAAEELWS